MAPLSNCSSIGLHVTGEGWRLVIVVLLSACYRGGVVIVVLLSCMLQGKGGNCSSVAFQVSGAGPQ